MYGFSYAQQQNIITNGGFENYTKCPDGLNRLSFVPGWFRVDMQSPDYFNTCELTNYASVPQNFWGYQYAKGGNGYGGGAFYDYYRKNIREHLINKLEKTLIKGQKYNFKMYVSLADSSYVAVNNLEAMVFENNPKSYGNNISDFKQNGTYVQMDTNYIISDQKRWIELNGKVIANGGERYLGIGNFKVDSNTNYVLVNKNVTYDVAYYYIDNVSLYKGDNSYDIQVDSLALYNPCHDSVGVKISNAGDSTLDFSQHPLTIVLALKQGSDTVQSLQKFITNNQHNSGLPLKKDSSFWVYFSPINYSGNTANYTLSAALTMAADSFPPNNFLEIPTLSVGNVSINKNILCQGDSVLLYSKKVIGDAVWQFSTDLQNWQDLGFADTLVDYPNTKGHYRLSICNKVYSDTLSIDLDKKDIGLEALVFSGSCYDSVGVKVVNHGCNPIDFGQNTIQLVLKLETNGQIIQQEQLTISNTQSPFAADSSLIVYFKSLSYLANQVNYKISVQINWAFDTFFQNNYIDTTYGLPFSVGLVSISDKEICEGDSIVLYSEYAIGAANWQFSTDGQNWENIGSADTLIDTPNTSGFYRMAVCDFYSDTLEIKVKPLPVAVSQVFQFCSPGEQLLQLDSNVNIAKLNWYKTSNGKTPFHQGFSYLGNINQTTKYYLESENNGCVSKERGMLKITIGGCTLEIPNVFTPNGDGINDVFKFRNAHGKTIYTKIFDRWSNEVAAFENNIGWDGKGAAAGTYYYVIETVGETYKGSVVLIR